MDLFDFRQYRIRYSVGKSTDKHELLVLQPNIVAARDYLFELHRDGKLYPPLSAYLPIKIWSVDDVSGV